MNRIPNLPSKTGICPSCTDYDDCTMPELLDQWWQLEDRVKGGDIAMDQQMYETYYIDEPDIKQGAVVWCPMYFNESLQQRG